jgi:hypothetical protein
MLLVVQIMIVPVAIILIIVVPMHVAKTLEIGDLVDVDVGDLVDVDLEVGNLVDVDLEVGDLVDVDLEIGDLVDYLEHMDHVNGTENIMINLIEVMVLPSRNCKEVWDIIGKNRIVKT